MQVGPDFNARAVLRFRVRVRLGRLDLGPSPFPIELGAVLRARPGIVSQPFTTKPAVSAEQERSKRERKEPARASHYIGIVELMLYINRSGM